MRYEPAASIDAPCLVLAHGAGAGHAHPWMRKVATGLAARGVSVVTFDFPYKVAGRNVPDKGPVLEAAFADAWREARELVAAQGARPSAFFAGGKSMGGRISSQTAARQLFEPATDGLVFFGYPLHPPGKPEQRRDRHLPDVACPMLFLHGTKDPFGTPDELRAVVDTLPQATLEIIDGGDHSLMRSKAADRVAPALEGAIDIAAEWLSKIASMKMV